MNFQWAPTFLTFLETQAEAFEDSAGLQRDFLALEAKERQDYAQVEALMQSSYVRTLSQNPQHAPETQLSLIFTCYGPFAVLSRGGLPFCQAIWN